MKPETEQEKFYRLQNAAQERGAKELFACLGMVALAVVVATILLVIFAKLTGG